MTIQRSQYSSHPAGVPEVKAASHRLIPEVTKESSLTSPHFLTYILPYSYIYIPTLCNFYTISGAAWVTLVIHLRGAHTFGWLSRYTSDNLRVGDTFRSKESDFATDADSTVGYLPLSPLVFSIWLRGLSAIKYHWVPFCARVLPEPGRSVSTPLLLLTLYAHHIPSRE